MYTGNVTALTYLYVKIRCAYSCNKTFYTDILPCYGAKNNNLLKTAFGDLPRADLVQRVARI